jgi:hypothetical protein
VRTKSEIESKGEVEVGEFGVGEWRNGGVLSVVDLPFTHYSSPISTLLHFSTAKLFFITAALKCCQCESVASIQFQYPIGN